MGGFILGIRKIKELFEAFSKFGFRRIREKIGLIEELFPNIYKIIKMHLVER